MTTNQRRRVCIVGASAAGLFAADRLAKAGCDVKVFEASPRLEPGFRTLIVTSRLRDLLGPLTERCVVNQVQKFELSAAGHTTTVTLSTPDLVVERRALIQHLARQACHSGAEICLGRRFASLKPEGPGVGLTLRDVDGNPHDATADAVIGADGTFSQVAAASGWRRPTTVPLVQAIVEPPKHWLPATVRVWFVPEDTPYFYWLIPESPTRAALGLIAADGVSGLKRLQSFAAQLGLTPLEYQAAKIPLYTGWTPPQRRLGSGRVYLVGDAAAHVKVTTVGGIVTGFLGAQGAAEAILNGGSSAAFRALRRELDRHLLIRKSLHRFNNANYVNLLSLLTPQAKQCLTTYNRDEAAKLLWRICLRQPRFLLTGMRALVASGISRRASV